MPPPIPAHQKRFTANPIRPGRYRPGKAVPEEESSEEESEAEVEVQQPKKPTRPAQARPQTTRPPTHRASDDDDDEDEDGFVTEDEDDQTGSAPVFTRSTETESSAGSVIAQPSSAVPKTQPLATRQDEHDDESEEDSESESESEEESSSEEEAPQRKFQRPTFVKKNERKSQQDSNMNDTPAVTSIPAPEVLSSHHNDQVAARRLAEAETMIKETIERDTTARLAGKKAWDDDEDLAPEALVDDTDGLDPEAEHSAWRLRELNRLKRDREAMISREQELEEIERRRNLTAEERDAEDKEYLAKQNEERDENRGKAGFLGKYHHKGAFFMDDEDSKRLAQRDLVGAKFADEVDKSTLPQYMQIRDMTKLGKKSRTRYTDLKGQDTGQFGNDVKRWRGSGYDNRVSQRDDLRGVDERFLPDDARGGPTASGANASAVGPRRPRERSRDRLADQRSGRNDSYRPRSRSKNAERYRRRDSHSRSRSRSPERGARRRRSPSPYRDRDKRRKVET